jgi:cation diffusion facilitator CzcD-associated flavoprotein CzcO
MRQLIEDAMNRGMTFALTELNAERERTGLAAIEVVADPELRRKLTPQHPFGCKRPLLSNDFYPAFNDPRLELVTDSIERITPTGVVTTDGVEREVDVLVLATGYAATKFVTTIDITGRDGVSIHEAWRDGARAYMGVTTSGFPNLFMLYGPNMNNGSIIQMIEYQVEHVIEILTTMADEDLSWIDVRPEAMERFNVEVQRAIDGIDVWNTNCNTYYRSPDGRIVTQWPFSMLEYRDMSVPVDWEAFQRVPGKVTT